MLFDKHFRGVHYGLQPTNQTECPFPLEVLLISKTNLGMLSLSRMLSSGHYRTMTKGFTSKLIKTKCAGFILSMQTMSSENELLVTVWSHKVSAFSSFQTCF